MPIFEYLCRKCNKIFETLVLKVSDKPKNCPYCRHKDLEKQFSKFAMGKSESASPLNTGGGGCSSCSEGDCSSCGS